MAEGDFGVGKVLLPNLTDLPEWAFNAGFKDDDFATLVDTADGQWISLGPGLWFKVIYVFEGGGALASIVKAEAGAKLPRRRYLGPSDMYFLSGSATFGDQPVAPGCWVHETAGAEEEVVQFHADTEFLANTYGPIVELTASGSVSRIIDGSSLRNLALIRTDGQQSVATYSQQDLGLAIHRPVAVSAKGMLIRDDKGREYLDASGGACL